MAQPSITNYFNNRKRSAVEDSKINAARKVLLLDGGNSQPAIKTFSETCVTVKSDKLNNVANDIPIKSCIVPDSNKQSPAVTMSRKIAISRAKKLQAVTKMGNVKQFLSNMSKSKVCEKLFQPTLDKADVVTPPCDTVKSERPTTPTKMVHIPPEPVTPTKSLNAMDKVNISGAGCSLNELKNKFSRSSRLAELKASMARFKESEKQLEAAESRTKQLQASPSLKTFKALELEVNLSPQKPQSPLKAYLSPKKDTAVRKNLIHLLSPTKNATHMPAATVSKETPIKESLTLPYKYLCLAEMFRAIDTVSQILYNRKETITFKKLKPAVEEMLKRNLTEKHLQQIKAVYPEAFTLKCEKLREFGSGTRHEQWELILVPQIEGNMTSELLLERRRKLYKILIEKLKDYHQEFLNTLEPPMKVCREKITRWHPSFDLQKVPDIEQVDLPQGPNEEKLTTGSEVLEKARSMFNCNTRMERALEKLKESQGTQTVKEVKVESVLKGIPKGLLEKVRQRQAAKALESITRTTTKEKEVELYSRLPEVARLARNLFVSEKKSVLPLDLVVDRLCNSYRLFSSKKEMEVYLKTISKEVSEWLVFHEIRGAVFVKLSKSADLSLVMTKLQNLTEQKKL